jgi:2-polyprenyl-3-methyl-5-hydroxy-6-metoxy-1,4-benzoquinol methylase
VARSNGVTLDGIRQLLNNQPKTKTYTVIDLGCGDGAMLREIARYGLKHQYHFKLLGIDANKDAIAYAKELSSAYPEIEYQSMDIFSERFKELNCDIALCTLFLHHFSQDQIYSFLTRLNNQTNLGIVANDLQRSELAYGLFRLLGLVISNPMVKQDGLTSILRAFKRQELVNLSKKLNLPYQIKWKWAFRYQWILKTKTQ